MWWSLLSFTDHTNKNLSKTMRWGTEIITVRPHGCGAKKGTGNKYITSHGLIQRTYSQPNINWLCRVWARDYWPVTSRPYSHASYWTLMHPDAFSWSKCNSGKMFAVTDTPKKTPWLVGSLTKSQIHVSIYPWDEDTLLVRGQDILGFGPRGSALEGFRWNLSNSQRGSTE